MNANHDFLKLEINPDKSYKSNGLVKLKVKHMDLVNLQNRVKPTEISIRKSNHN